MRPVSRRAAVFASGLLAALVVARPASAQVFSTRGFVEVRAALFPQDTRNDTQNVVLDLLARQEAFATLTPWLQLAGGVDLRANSHDQVSDSWALRFKDREPLRPALTVRRLSATITRGAVTLDAGKQFIRWGKADIVTPTDRFAPRDFVNVVNSEFLPVTGARLTIQAGAEAFEVAWVPLFTPSRVPRFDQRWTAVPPSGPLFSISDAGAAYPARAQIGVRWSHMGDGYEYSASVFDGFNHLPSVEIRPAETPLSFDAALHYPGIRMYGADAAIPTPWFTLKGEGALFVARDTEAVRSDDYVLYVIQAERQTGEWLLTGGYAGESVVERRAPAGFSPERGMARSVIMRASYTIDPRRSAAAEAAIRDNGEGLYAKGEYSWTRGQHWRYTLAGVLLAGDEADFIGQYRRNSHLTLILRYSF